MAKSDHDLLDGAMDKAEVAIAEPAAETPEIKGIDAQTETEPDQTPEPEAAKEEAAETDSDQEASAETEPTDPTPETPAAETVEAPAFWTAETKALFSKASPELQKALSEEAKRQQQQVSRLANEAQRGKTFEQRVNADFSKPEELAAHKAQLRLLGVNDEVGELHRYRDWNRVLKSDPVTVINALIKEHGVTREELEGEPLSDDQQNAINDPRIDEVISEFRTLKEQQEAERKAREDAVLGAEINAFKAEKDSYGEPRAKFAALYAPQIDQVYHQVLAHNEENGISMSLKEALSHAYDHVQKQIYEAHGIRPNAPKPPSKETVIANAKKAQAAAVSATGAPRTDVITQKARKPYKNDKEMVDAAMNRALERSSAR